MRVQAQVIYNESIYDPEKGCDTLFEWAHLESNITSLFLVAQDTILTHKVVLSVLIHQYDTWHDPYEWLALGHASVFLKFSFYLFPTPTFLLL